MKYLHFAKGDRHYIFSYNHANEVIRELLINQLSGDFNLQSNDIVSVGRYLGTNPPITNDQDLRIEVKGKARPDE